MPPKQAKISLFMQKPRAKKASTVTRRCCVCKAALVDQQRQVICARVRDLETSLVGNLYFCSAEHRLQGQPGKGKLTKFIPL